MGAVHVEAFPDSPKDYNLMHNNGAVLVAYKGRVVEEVTDCGLESNELEFVVSFLFRNLRKRDAHQGVYGALEIAQASLKGFAKLHSEKFTDFNNGVWEYAQLYRVNKIG